MSFKEKNKTYQYNYLHAISLSQLEVLQLHSTKWLQTSLLTFTSHDCVQYCHLPDRNPYKSNGVAFDSLFCKHPAKEIVLKEIAHKEELEYELCRTHTHTSLLASAHLLQQSGENCDKDELWRNCHFVFLML